MKVITKDFQILKGEIEWDFPVGITIIQGESGNGKSTLIFAIENCLMNPAGVDDAINWDAKQAEVTIENNGQKVKWIKTSSSSAYVNELTGQEYIKASKLDSRDIGDLGFYFDQKGNVVNIHDMWSVLFPFGATDSEMFKLFEDIFNISSSFQIIEEMKSDEKDVKDQITTIDKDTNKLKQQKLEIENILNSVDKAKVTELIDKLQIQSKNMELFNSDIETYNQNYGLKNIQLPVTFNTSNLIKASDYYNQIQKDYNNYLAQLGLKNVKLPKEKKFDFTTPQIIKDFDEYNKLLQIKSGYDEELAMWESKEEEINEKLSKFKICPTCGRVIGECDERN